MRGRGGTGWSGRRLRRPRPDLAVVLTTVSFSQQSASTWTPARLANNVFNIPAFKANVHTWLFSTEYTPTPSLVLTNTLQYTGARNFNDYAALGIPYGADFDQVNLTTGLQWTFKEHTKIEAAYGFYAYQPNRNAEFGGYEAHLISLELSKKYKHWICDEQRMQLVKKECIYMHCLPADRNLEVTDDVIDGTCSVVYDEAQHRLHAQKAVMALTMS